MSAETFYLTVFLVGFILAAVSLISGTLHLPFGHGLHLPHGHGPAPHLPHGPGHGGAGHPAGPGAGSHTGVSPAGGGGIAASAAAIPPFNFATILVFLAWFGGVGFLLTGHSRLASLAVLALAIASGFAGAAVVFSFLTRVLARRESALDPADFEMVGVLGRVSMPIRAGGTGEITFSQGRTRRCSGARRDGEGEIGRGSEVIVTRYEKGIAYVRPWEELL